MQAQMLDAITHVYEKPDLFSPTVSELHEGDEVDIVKTVANDQWVQVTLADNRTGFIAGATRIYQVKNAALLQDADVRAEANTDSSVEMTLVKGATIQILGIEEGDKRWVKIKTTSGSIGFIRPETRIQEFTGKAPRQYGRYGAHPGRTNMLIGGVICVIGTVVTIASYSAVSESGGSYFVAWGAIVFGAYRFIVGAVQMSRGE